jgi:hypothetical protein
MLPLRVLQYIWLQAFRGIRRADRLYVRLLVHIVLIIALVLFGTFCNAQGWEEVSLVLALPVGFLLASVWARPRYLAFMTFLGLLLGLPPGQRIGPEIRGILRIYFIALRATLFWAEATPLFLGVIPIKENPWALLYIAVATFVLALAGGAGFAKTLVIWFARIVIVVAAMSLVPSAFWVSTLGVDLNPKSWVAASPEQKLLIDIKKEEEERQSLENQKRLEKILTIKRSGGELSKEDEAFLKQQEVDAKRGTLRGKISGLFGIPIERNPLLATLATFATLYILRVVWRTRGTPKWADIRGPVYVLLILLLIFFIRNPEESVKEGKETVAKWRNATIGRWEMVGAKDCKVAWISDYDKGWCYAGTYDPGTYRIVPKYESWTLGTASGTRLTCTPRGIPISQWKGTSNYEEFHSYAPYPANEMNCSLVARIGETTVIDPLKQEEVVLSKKQDIWINVNLIPHPERYSGAKGNIAVAIEQHIN